MAIRANLTGLVQTLSQHVTLVVVSKMQPPERIMEAYEAGQRDFGENRVQEMISKKELLPGDIRWHLVGHLQTNKVRMIVPFVHLIHSIDSLRLLQEVNKEGQRINRVIPCLLEFHIATEETKFGLSFGEATALLESQEYREMQNVSICGVMGMASFVDDETLLRSEFRQLSTWFHKLRSTYFTINQEFNIISMGMSGDYPIAIEEGSTLVRIGTKIFGEL